MKRIALALSLIAVVTGCASSAPVERPIAPPAPVKSQEKSCDTPATNSPIYANLFFNGQKDPAIAVRPGWTVPVPMSGFTIELTFPKVVDQRTVKASLESPDWRLEPYKGDGFVTAYTVLVVPKAEPPKPGMITLHVQEVQGQDGTALVTEPFTIRFAAVAPGAPVPLCATMAPIYQK